MENNLGIVYIAGKISGDPKYKEKFARAEVQLRKKGYVVLNPATLPEGMEYEQYMNICFAMIHEAGSIYMLKDYKDSPGAKRELVRAANTNKIIIMEQ